MSVCVCERKSVCLCVREKEMLYVRKKERERVCVCVCERKSASVYKYYRKDVRIPRSSTIRVNRKLECHDKWVCSSLEHSLSYTKIFHTGSRVTL